MSELYFNGTILTMDDKAPRVEAILVRNGRILKRGTKEELMAFREGDTVCIDMQGKTMLPGFIDGHSHFSGVANSLLQCDLSQAENFADIIRMMKGFIQKNEIPRGQWVIGTNYDHNFLAEKQHPDKNVLNEISDKHPIVIIHASSHMGVANSEALRAQGLESDTKDPSGGHYGRLTDTDELNGYMEENAFVSFRNQMPMPDLKEMMRLFKKAQEIYAGYGITTVQEGMVTALLFQMLQYAEQNQVLYLDLVGYLDLENCADLLTQHKEYAEQYQHHFRIGGYKIFLDGSPQGRTAWMKAPYKDAQDGYCGYPIKENQELYQLILTALRNHQQLLAHCNGDAAAEQYITQFEKVMREHPKYNANRPVMIHAQFVQKEQLVRMKKLSMMPSFFVAHTYYWGDIHIQNVGMKRAKEISPAGTAVSLGLPFTFHQDSPVLMPDVFQTIWCAVRRITKSGVRLSEDERISVYDALKAMTVYAAYQYGEENEKGTIEEGKMADLILLDRNPLEIPVDEVKKVRILETIKNGNVVFQAE